MELEAIRGERDLDVFIMDNLKLREQCNSAAAKLMLVPGMISWHFKKLDRQQRDSTVTKEKYYFYTIV